MMCTRVREPAPAELWPALLAMRRWARAETPERAAVVELRRLAGGWQFGPRSGAGAAVEQRIVLRSDGARWSADAAGGTPTAVLQLDDAGAPQWQGPAAESGAANGHAAADDVPAFVRLYAPLLLGLRRATDRGGIAVTGHLTQTLDGRIACANGSSQWIGNDADLRHTHRLRALHDAILVGGRTVERDDPQLTVRRVDGEDPVRCVLNGSASTLRAGRPYRVFDGRGALVLCAEGAIDDRALPAGAEVLALPADAEGRLDPAAVCAALVQRGVRSLFVEGGGRTLSGFLSAARLDALHVHVAPIVLGAGVPGFTLPAVDAIGDATRLAPDCYSLDGELLLASFPSTAARRVAENVAEGSA